MTERESREGGGDTKDNVRDDLDEASEKRKKDATTGAGEEESTGGGGGGVKGNVSDDLEKTQGS